MDRILNPFAPGAGTPPPELVGRQEVLDNARTCFGRIKAGRPAKSFLLVGLRGVGKTVLLNRFQDIADADGFKTFLVEAPDTKRLPELLVPALRKILLSLDRSENISEHVRQCWRVLKSFAKSFKIEYGDIGLSITCRGPICRTNTK